MALVYWSVHDSVTVRTSRTRYQNLETEAAKWSLAITDFIIFTRAFSASMKKTNVIFMILIQCDDIPWSISYWKVLLKINTVLVFISYQIAAFKWQQFGLMEVGKETDGQGIPWGTSCLDWRAPIFFIDTYIYFYICYLCSVFFLHCLLLQYCKCPHLILSHLIYLFITLFIILFLSNSVNFLNKSSIKKKNLSY